MVTQGILADKINTAMSIPANQRIPHRQSAVTHILSGSRFGNWMRLLRENRIEPRFLLKAISITIHAAVGSMLPGGKRAMHRADRETIVAKDPVFVIGHWRSGTTMLHELLACDATLGILPFSLALAPDVAMRYPKLFGLFEKFLGDTRPMDNMPTAMGLPAEDEFGLTALTTRSFCHAQCFPQNASRYLCRAMFDDADEADRLAWMETYLALLRRVTRLNDGRRLLLKDPMHTARIPELLEMFPGARFVHIRRNPFVTYLSMIRMHKSLAPQMALQSTSHAEIERFTIETFEKVVGRYFQTRDLIPPGQLVEVRYEDLVADPMGRLADVYDVLALDGFAEAKAAMQGYLDERQDYVVSQYTMDDATIRRVREAWGFAIDRWGYEPPACGAG